MSEEQEDKNKLLFSQNILKDVFVKNQRLDSRLACPSPSAKAKQEGCYQKFLESDFLLETEYELEAAQKWVTYPGILKISFPLQTIQPKVQMIRRVTRKKLPRDVEVDRRRRYYAQANLPDLLKQAHIESYKLMDVKTYEDLCDKFKVNKYRLDRLTYMPLKIFDNSDFCSYTPRKWLNLGLVDGVYHPLPANAFLPVITVDELDTNLETFDEVRNKIYDWRIVAVRDYDELTRLWTVQRLDNAEFYKIPKIQFMFIAENPNTYVLRLEQALNLRAHLEHLMKFQLIVDCLQTSAVGEVPQKLHSRLTSILAKIKTGASKAFVEALKKELISNYQRVMTIYDFENYVELHPTDFPHLHSIKEDLKADHIKGNKTLDAKGKPVKFFNMKVKVRVNTLFYMFSSWEAMYKVNFECCVIEAMNLFIPVLPKVMPLSDFLTHQQYVCVDTVKYLKGFWIENLASQICICLRSVGKGWMDLGTHEWTVYGVAKIFRFLLEVKIRMESSMQLFMERAITNFEKLVNKPCTDFKNIDQDFVWTENFINTPFPTKTIPVFYMLLQLSPNGAFYSTDPYEFKPKLQKLFYDSLVYTNGVKIIDYMVMSKLDFAKNLYIKTVELIEPYYVEVRDKLEISYRNAVYPLLQYAEKYQVYVPLYVLVVNDFIKEMETNKISSQEVKKEIIDQRRLKQELKDDLPATIVIGPFFINVDPLKQFLIAKRTEIVKRIFEYYVDRMNTTTEELVEEFNIINNKITERPLSIEHLLEIQDYIKIVPDLVEVLQEKVKIMMLEYEVLDYFWYNISDAQFAMKWDVFGWPFQIFVKMFAIKEEHKNDIEEFKKQQISEVGGFQERLESLNEEVQAFSLQFNANKAVEYSVKIKHQWKIINEMADYGNLLKKRQLIFEMEDLSLEFLESIVSSFEPYKNLWFACADFIKHEDATLGNPIVGIEPDEVYKILDDLERTLTNSVEVFAEKPEIADCAIVFIKRIEEFRPVVELIETVKHPCWLLMHWQELAGKAGIEIKFSMSMNFLYCMKKGIMEHYDLVKDIGRRSIEEADAIQRALEEEERRKMEEEELRLAKKAARKCRTDIL